MSHLTNVLKALNIANKNIDRLELENMKLKNESINKDKAIDQQKQEIKKLKKLVGIYPYA
tara:strand:- start:1295 stop:1474 length:180 start_codon:yes stop_codon:yes gene_type:complete